MREDWIEVELKQAGKVVSGGTPKTSISEFWGDEISWITPADLSGYHDKYITKGRKSISRKGLEKSSAKLMPEGSVLFSSRAPIGYTVIAKNELATNQGFKSLIPRSFLNSEFLYYYLRSFKQGAEKKASGTTFKELSGKAFSELPIPLPPLPEQRAIVAKIEQLFSELDNGIANLTKAQEQLKIYRQAVLKKAFEGELTREWRAQQTDLPSADELLEQIREEREKNYQQQLEEWKLAVKDWEANGKKGKKPGKPKKPLTVSSLPHQDINVNLDIVGNWIFLRYEHLCTRIKNGISKKPDGTEGDLRIFRISAVRPHKFILEDYRNIKDKDGEYKDFFLHKGDLVFTRYNGTRKYVGISAQFISDELYLYPDKLILTRLLDGILIPSFYEYATNTSVSREFVESRIRTTAGQSGISGSDIKSMPVPYCSKQEQQLIIQEIETRLSVCDKLEEDIHENLKKSEALRQSILKQAFEGKLLNQAELDACRQEQDWEPAEKLLQRIKNETKH